MWLTVKSFRQRYNRTPSEKDLDYLREVERREILSKIFLTDEPVMSPGRCANCGASGGDRKYVDFGLTVEDYGIVYICSVCVGELFRLFNFEPVATNLKFKTMQHHITVLESVNTELQGVVVRLHSKLENFKKELTHVQSVVDNRPDPVSGNIDPDLVLGTSSKDVNESIDNSRTEAAATGTGEAKKRASKSTTGTGRTNVPSLTELLNKPTN